jgi:hypothetical protein
MVCWGKPAGEGGDDEVFEFDMMKLKYVYVEMKEETVRVLKPQ